MMHRTNKHLCSGDQGYCNEKRSVNARGDGTAHLATFFARPRDADEYQPSSWYCPSVRKLWSAPLFPSTAPTARKSPQTRVVYNPWRF